MGFVRSFKKPLSCLLSVAVLSAGLPLNVVSAAMVTTEQALDAAQAQQARNTVLAALDRNDVQTRLISLGVDPAAAAERVEALTDAEAIALAERMDRLPAGGDALGTLVFVFLVLLVTDILGYTDIFPFVKKTAR